MTSAIFDKLVSRGRFIMRMFDFAETQTGAVPDGTLRLYYDPADQHQYLQTFSLATGLWEAFHPASVLPPIGADYLVGTANATLTSEIAVGTTPGGELGNTWASPAVDTVHAEGGHSAMIATHAGSATVHHTKYTDAEAISAVEGEATLALGGDVTIDGAKTLSVDVINEKDSAAGVTIDGVLIKDGQVDGLDLGATGITAAELETLSDGSNSDALHSHAGSIWDIIEEGSMPTSGTDIFDVSSISTDYDLFKIFVNLSPPTTSSSVLTLRFNGDSGSNYYWNGMRMQATTATSFVNDNSGGATSGIQVCPVGNATASGRGQQLEITIQKETAADEAYVHCLWSGRMSGDARQGGTVWGHWDSASKIDQITLLGPTLSGSSGGHYIILGRNVA